MDGTLKEICETYYYRNNPAIRSPKTKRQYDYALSDFAEAVGHVPTQLDLTDDSVSAMLAHLQNKGLAAKTINERAGRIVALWNGSISGGIWTAGRKPSSCPCRGVCRWPGHDRS